jgi:GPI ethanolamine phosphate transferase 3 subunit O
VKDLDTVDNGILRYLETEIVGNENEIEGLYKNETKYGKSFHFRKWDFLVAHFLGVDHAGHRYGIYHPRMNEKLKQMNSVLELIVSKMDNDTILMLFVSIFILKSKGRPWND